MPPGVALRFALPFSCHLDTRNFAARPPILNRVDMDLEGMKRNNLHQTAIAYALGISTARVSQLQKLGMPKNSVVGAKVWMQANVRGYEKSKCVTALSTSS